MAKKVIHFKKSRIRQLTYLTTFLPQKIYKTG